MQLEEFIQNVACIIDTIDRTNLKKAGIVLLTEK